ncbi:MAG: hypothetical protein PHD36_09255 [Desulfotomaculaceae bacterium]|nr:hypothetical protein [Desulfotomaculaceae bacterium]
MSFFEKGGNRQKDNVIDFPPRQVILTDTDGEQVKITGKNAQVVKGLTEMLNDILNEKQNPAKIDHDKDCPPF